MTISLLSEKRNSGKYLAGVFLERDEFTVIKNVRYRLYFFYSNLHTSFSILREKSTVFLLLWQGFTFLL